MAGQGVSGGIKLRRAALLSRWTCSDQFKCTAEGAGGIIKKHFHVIHKPALELTGPFCGLLKFFKDGALQDWLYVMYIHYLHL